MKKNIFLLLFIMTIALVSCSTEEEMVKKVTLEDIEGISSTKWHVNTEWPAHVPPYGHKSYLMYGLSFKDLDIIYREEFDQPDSLKLSYNTNVKNKAFKQLMVKGLAEKGTAEQKKYYLNEQLELENDLPAFYHFNMLLQASLDILSKDEALAMAKRFYDKKSIALSKIEWGTLEETEAARTRLEYTHSKTVRFIILYAK